jgi:hypothetical protein
VIRRRKKSGSQSTNGLAAAVGNNAEIDVNAGNPDARFPPEKAGRTLIRKSSTETLWYDEP